MKRIKKIFPVFLLLVASFAFTYQEVLLRRELKENTKESYQFDLSGSQMISMPSAGVTDMPMKFTSGMRFRFELGSVDREKKEADVRMVISDLKFDVEGMPPPPMGDVPKEIEIKGKLDERNRIKGIDFKSLPAEYQMMSGVSSNIGFWMVEFPEKPVKEGDSWEIKYPYPLAPNKEITLRATFKGSKDYKDKSVHWITIEGEIIMQGDIAEMLKDNPQAAMVGKMLVDAKYQLTGETLIEKTSGKVLHAEYNMKGKQKMDVVDMNQTMEMSGDFKAIVTYQEEK